jgi:hypothetical protein
VHSVLLRVAATMLTLATAVAAAVHVSGHQRSAAAPLHPPVLGQPAPAPGGQLHLSPSVRLGDARPVTSTYVS